MDEVIELVSSILSTVSERHLNYHRFLSSLTWYQIYLIFLLFSININAHMARYFITYLYANPSLDSFHSLSVSTNISSFGYGNIIGFGFSLSFVFFGTWTARLVHFHNPKRMLLFGLVTWNLSLFMLTNADSFGKLMGSRIILGLGQAFSGPVCYSLLNHFFPQDDYKPILHSLFNYGSYVGIAFSSLLYLITQPGSSNLLSEEGGGGGGWKQGCQYIYISGFLLTMALLFTLPKTAKPIRGKLKKEIKPPLHTIEDAFHEFHRNNALLLLLLIGSIRFMFEYILLSYLPLFYLHKFSSFYSDADTAASSSTATESQPGSSIFFNIFNAIFVLIVGALVSVLHSASGQVLVMDRPGCVYGSCHYLTLLILSTLIALPTLLLTFLSPYLSLSLFGLLLTYLLTDWWFRPFLFIFQRELSPHSRNIGLGFLSITTSFAGSMATTVVGYFIGKRDDNLHGNIHVPPHNVTITLAWSCGAILILSALLFGVCPRPYPAPP
jgi:MFS family permease